MNYKRGQLIITLENGKSMMHVYNTEAELLSDAAWVYEYGKEVGESVELVCLDGYKLTYLGVGEDGEAVFADDDGAYRFVQL